MDDERYGIGELADAAGVSVRTVRYYIAEGLLPPAVIAGARSYYTSEHLDRLRLIGRLKDAFLPLKEIRRHLTQLDEQSIRQIADEEPSYAGDILPVADAPPPPSAARAVHRIEDVHVPDGPAAPNAASAYIAKILHRTPPRQSIDRTRVLGHVPAAAPDPRPASAPDNHESWRRIPIGDGAELLVRDELYQRRREKIDWLISWATKVIE